MVVKNRKVDTLTRQLISSIKNRTDIQLKEYSLRYRTESYSFLRISSSEIGPNDKVLLIRASLHGDEVAGYWTIHNHLNQILDYAHGNGVKVIIYPLGNPSGFEHHTRYNFDGDQGDYVNNHFLQYELKDGTRLKDIGESEDYTQWYWASDPKLNIRLAPETKLMHELLRNDPLNQIKAVIDLHQDYFTPNIGPATYHYAYGDLSRYSGIVAELRKIIPILGNFDIGAGFETSMMSDDDGFIIRNDGSLPDLFHRLGCAHCITPETTGATPLDLACQVNLIWILRIIDLIKD